MDRWSGRPWSAEIILVHARAGITMKSGTGLIAMFVVVDPESRGMHGEADEDEFR